MADLNIESSRRVLVQEESEESFLARCLQKRYILGIMGFWCFFVLSALRLNISIAIVAMVNWTEVRKEQSISMDTSETCHYGPTQERPRKEDGPFVWEPATQGHILGCYFYGLAATQLLGGRMAEVVSAKWVLFIGTTTATMSTLVVPIAAAHNGFALMVLQMLKGFGQGIMMPAFSVLMAKWVPPSERARFMSFIVSGIPVGGFVTVVLSGYICKTPSIGWPYAFYIFAILGAAWCVVWMLVIYESPLSHPYITRAELGRIMSLRSQKAPQLALSVPFKAILTSKAVWAYLCVGFASFWQLSLYVAVLPLYMGTILRFDIEQNGVMSSFPNLLQAAVLISTSLVSDYLQKKTALRTTITRKIFISTGLCSYALCMALVVFAECNRNLSVAFLVFALGMSGFNFASVAVVPVDMSPRFAGTVSGIMNTFGALSGVIIPATIGYLTEHKQTVNQWAYLFYTSAAICLLAALIFLIFGSSETQSWNQLPAQPSNPAVDDEEDNSEREVDLPEQQADVPKKEEEKEEPKEKPPSPKESKKSTETPDRPWRTESFPPLQTPTEPSVTISYV